MNDQDSPLTFTPQAEEDRKAWERIIGRMKGMQRMTNIKLYYKRYNKLPQF